mmetsp:Transcript_8471/g.18555  ORF Transcript_8471/g.18555 Transcript_8471/m.18555 type:complete len:451 (-) Transcript_8471:47-1399(-)
MLADAAGNANEYINTKGVYQVTTADDSIASQLTPPSVLAVTATNTAITYRFSEAMQVANEPPVTIHRCSATGDCRSPTEVAALMDSDSWVRSAIRAEYRIPVHHHMVLETGARYVVKLGAGLTNDDLVALAATEHEVVVGAAAAAMPVSTGVSADRVMVIPCSGVCGRARPAAQVATCPGSVDHGEDCSGVAAWSLSWPKNWGFRSDVPADTAAAARTYASTDGFCSAGANINVAAHADQCFSKCLAGARCTGPRCFCGGARDGYDTGASNALCLDVAGCTAACDATTGCTSVDMHRTRTRCFLNVETCTPTTVEASAEYTHMYMSTVEAQGRRLQEDKGYSSDKVLRFAPLSFTTQGKYKLCFCDSVLQRSLNGPSSYGSDCNDHTDFNVEVGTIHVSGVSCLLDRPQLRRGECVKQYHGGLRCYPRGQAVGVEFDTLPAALPTLPMVA